jgi:hypothetical protein
MSTKKLQILAPESHLKRPTLSPADWRELTLAVADPNKRDEHVFADGVLTPAKWKFVWDVLIAMLGKQGISPQNVVVEEKSWAAQLVSIAAKIGKDGCLAAAHLDEIPESIKPLLAGRKMGGYSTMSKAAAKTIKDGKPTLVPGKTKTPGAWSSEGVLEEDVLARFEKYLPMCECQMCINYRTTIENEIRMQRFKARIDAFNTKFFGDTSVDPSKLVRAHPELWATTSAEGWTTYPAFPAVPDFAGGFVQELGSPALSAIVFPSPTGEELREVAAEQARETGAEIPF